MDPEGQANSLTRVLWHWGEVGPNLMAMNFLTLVLLSLLLG